MYSYCNDHLFLYILCFFLCIMSVSLCCSVYGLYVYVCCNYFMFLCSFKEKIYELENIFFIVLFPHSASIFYQYNSVMRKKILTRFTINYQNDIYLYSHKIIKWRCNVSHICLETMNILTTQAVTQSSIISTITYYSMDVYRKTFKFFK